MKDPVAFDFDGEYGAGYDRLVQIVIPGYDQLFEATLSLFRTFLPDQARVLVAGCGTGKEISTMAPREPGWRFTGVDPSARMVETTHRRAVALGVDDRTDLHVGLVSDLPPDPAFDAATVINVVHFLPDDGAKDDLVRSVSARVRPGGCVAVFDLCGDPEGDEFRRLSAAWAHFMALRGLTGEARGHFLERLERGIVYVPEARVVEIFRDAGLSLVTTYFAGLHYRGWLLVRSEAD